MPVIMRMEISAGAEIAINYNAANRRLTDVIWALAPGLDDFAFTGTVPGISTWKSRNWSVKWHHS